MSQTEFVLTRLERERGRYREIAARTGVPYSTLAKIAQRQIRNPGSRHIDALAALFRAEDAKAKPAGVVLESASA